MEQFGINHIGEIFLIGTALFITNRTGGISHIGMGPSGIKVAG